VDLNRLLEETLARDASDLHLAAGRPPALRIYGNLVFRRDLPPLDRRELDGFLEVLATAEQRATFAQDCELDFAYTSQTGARFRVNVARQRGELALALRPIQGAPPSLAGLGLPAVCATLVQRDQGLVLVTGPTGSGKSTTLAAMLDYINHAAARHIVTVEDPIEYLFTDDRCLFTQREVGADTHSFAAALKHALRQDPDVIMVGEMRDLATISMTLTAAETGHLVLATLHTPSAPESIDRIVDVFPAHQQTQVRTQLAMTLAGVISQRLVPRSGSDGRVALCEVMIGTSAIRNLIREGKTPQMVSAIQAGRAVGMQTFSQAAQTLYRDGLIDGQTATTLSIP
jgi:twitching motility protein PilT